MYLLLTTATATPVLVQKCIKQDLNQFRMSFRLSISSQFYCISQQSSALSRVTVNVTFSHLKKKMLQLPPNIKCVQLQPQFLFDNSVIFCYFKLFFLSCSFIETPQKEGNLLYRLISSESNKSV